ncbi:LAME_0A00540g1_1 [Lachancea meyersii CBS 8951]|uniref:LAME_0A00540g1_1 n=1 Tax=Lachancea meyersii CBS 8951 TaxID=1266667 RepID=A0A1G4IL66_9SACH|nr:LAME_0A00540g1_1 [Lachancea meyersii CBS 8951]
MLGNLKICLTLGLGLIQTAKAMPAFAPPPSVSGWVRNGEALYFQTNDKDNAVVSVKIMENGTLGQAHSFYTNGTGASMISAATNMTTSPDGLSSQGAIAVVGHNIFVVNAGDNTVSMFSIDEEDPANITLLGAPAAVPGDFPVTVAASALNNLVCVGTSGTRSGVACAPYSPFVGIGKMDFLRPFDLDQSETPVGPLDTVSQVLFSDDETKLLVTVKGAPAMGKTGFLAVFPVTGQCLTGEAKVAASRIESTLNGTVALFGFEQIANSNRYFVADAGYGAAIISVDENTDSSQLLHKQVISDQKATCWAAISPATNSVFVTDPLVNHIVEMSLIDASITSVINTTTTNDATGYIDLTAAGNFVYFLSPGTTQGSGAEIAVLSVGEGQSKKIIQSFNLGSLAGSSAQGLAVYP